MRVPRVTAAAVAFVLASTAAVVLVMTAAARRSPPAAARPGRDLASRITALLAPLNPDQPYRHPNAAERVTATTAFADLLATAPHIDAAAVDGFARLGWSTVDDIDRATGRRYALIAQDEQGDRAWGAVLVDLSGPLRVALQVPHPRTDIGTEVVGLDLFRQVPGALVMFAGAHRRAAGGIADVAHNEETLFHALSTVLAERHLPQVQLHGYADQNLPDAQVAVSAGAGQPSALARRVGDRLDEGGLRTCRAWAQQCGRLEGTGNVQGRAADRAGSVFVHLEMSNTVRADPARRAVLVAALAAADLPATD
jgi:hypothetical protein